MSAVAARELAALRLQVAQLAERLVALEQRVCPPTDSDLIAVIANSTRGRVFSAGELFAHRVVDDQLRTALDRVQASSSRRVGKLLARLSRVKSGRYRLEHIGRDEAGIVWAVSARDLQADAGVTSHRGV